MQLIIGNKNYSSWSMRPWLLLKHFGLEFEEVRIPLFVDGYKEKLAKYSPTLRVPVLVDNECTVWDSLAILEYLNETYLDGSALPKNIKQRALCRSYCAEMHAGFFELRKQMPMNCRQRRQLSVGEELQGEIDRVDKLWSDARSNYGETGDYLFGNFSLADCMYAPVAMRFQSYGIELSPESAAYQAFLRTNSAVSAWIEEARQEQESLPDYEIGTLLGE